MNGHSRERQVRKHLEDEGWFVVRAAGSLGEVDLVALKDGEDPQLVEVKATAGGPYAHFGPSDRSELLDAAAKAGADAMLCWWPANRKPLWIHSSAWPR